MNIELKIKKTQYINKKNTFKLKQQSNITNS